VDPVKARANGNTGLGLAITRDIVEDARRQREGGEQPRRRYQLRDLASPQRAAGLSGDHQARGGAMMPRRVMIVLVAVAASLLFATGVVTALLIAGDDNGSDTAAAGKSGTGKGYLGLTVSANPLQGLRVASVEPDGPAAKGLGRRHRAVGRRPGSADA
jgi:hypothetical protein